MSRSSLSTNNPKPTLPITLDGITVLKTYSRKRKYSAPNLPSYQRPYDKFTHLYELNWRGRSGFCGCERECRADHHIKIFNHRKKSRYGDLDDSETKAETTFRLRYWEELVLQQMGARGEVDIGGVKGGSEISNTDMNNKSADNDKSGEYGYESEREDDDADRFYYEGNDENHWPWRMSNLVKDGDTFRSLSRSDDVIQGSVQAPMVNHGPAKIFELPNEALSRIFEFLDPISAVMARFACKQFDAIYIFNRLPEKLPLSTPCTWTIGEQVCEGNYNKFCCQKACPFTHLRQGCCLKWHIMKELPSTYEFTEQGGWPRFYKGLAGKWGASGGSGRGADGKSLRVRKLMRKKVEVEEVEESEVEEVKDDEVEE